MSTEMTESSNVNAAEETDNDEKQISIFVDDEKDEPCMLSKSDAGENLKAENGNHVESLVEVIIENKPLVVPDGGYGWVIVFASHLIHFIIGGIERSAGLLYLQFLYRYNQSATATAWLCSVAAGIRLLIGPVTSAFSQRYSCRTAVFWGGIIYCISMVISAFSPSLYYLFLSFGILGGIGRSLAYCPAVVIVGYYFNKKRGAAVGIATSGVGFGNFVIPQIIELVFNYYLFTGAFLIIGAITLNISVGGLLMRPLSVHRKIQDIEKRKQERQKDTLLPKETVPETQTTSLKRHDDNLYDSIGRSLAYCPAVVIVGYYFNKKRGAAVGIATSGVGFGNFVIPQIIELVFNYYLFTGAFLIIGAITLNISVGGLLMRPLSVHRKIQDIEKRKQERQKDTLLPKETVPETQTTSLKRHDDNLYDSIDFTIPVLKDDEVIKKNSSFSNLKSRLSSITKRKEQKSKEPKKKKKMFEFSLLKDYRFASFCFAILLFTIASQSAFVFLPPYIKQIGGGNTEAALSVVVAGVFDGIGRILSGFILEIERIRPYRMYIYNLNLFLVAVISFVIPNFTSFIPIAITCAVFGLLVGCYISQKSVVIVDLLGPEKLNLSFGIMILFQGIGMFIGPTIGGLIKDINGEYNYSFYFGGAALLVGGLILFLSNVRHYVLCKRSGQSHLVHKLEL